MSFLFGFAYYFTCILVDGILRNDSAHARCRINVRVPSDHGSRVADRVAADLDVVAEHCAELLDACFDVLGSVVNDDELLVGLYVRGDRTRAHVGEVAQNGVAYVVVVGSLNVVEENDVLELNGVADNAVRADESRASDESAVSYLCFGSDDAGCAEVCGLKNLCGLVNPNALCSLLVVVAEGGTELEDKVLDTL